MRSVRGPRDVLAGASLVALALFALWAGSDLDPGTLRQMGPGMLPRATASLVGISGLALIGFGLARVGPGLDRASVRGPLFVTVAIVAFALTIRTVGLAVAGPLVVVIGGLASEEARPRELLLFAVLVTAFCIGLFRYVLSLPIPVLILPGIVTI